MRATIQFTTIICASIFYLAGSSLSGLSCHLIYMVEISAQKQPTNFSPPSPFKFGGGDSSRIRVRWTNWALLDENDSCCTVYKAFLEESCFDFANMQQKFHAIKMCVCHHMYYHNDLRSSSFMVFPAHKKSLSKTNHAHCTLRIKNIFTEQSRGSMQKKSGAKRN